MVCRSLGVKGVRTKSWTEYMMKNGMFYGRSWQDITLENFMRQIKEYMVWYRDERIKLSLGGLSPAEFRSEMGIVI